MTDTDDSLTVAREEERGFAAAAHLVTAIPLWGFIFLAAIWIYFKERSREVVFHVQQAVVFQMLFLAVGVFALLVQIVIQVVGVLNEGLAGFLTRMNLFFLISCYSVYALVCLWGTVWTLMGRPFLYPVIGARVLHGNLTRESSGSDEP